MRHLLQIERCEFLFLDRSYLAKELSLADNLGQQDGDSVFEVVEKTT